MKESKIVVFKLGSSLIVGSDGAARTAWLDSLAEECKNLIARGVRPVIVSSGAIALGRETLSLGKKALSLREKQAASAVGQVSLSSMFQNIFNIKKIPVAQVLLTGYTTSDENKESYKNAVNTLHTLISMNVVPVINENDVVATDEIKLGDNDRLSAIVAKMVGADVLFLFSDISGLYTKDPKEDAHARLIPVVSQVDDAITAMAAGTKNAIATGGMTTKLLAAKMCLEAGCKMVIMHGKEEYPLRRLMRGEECTWFIGGQK